MPKRPPLYIQNGTEPPGNVKRARRDKRGLMLSALSPEEIMAWRLKAAAGEVTIREIAAQTGLSLYTIRDKYKIKNRRKSPRLEWTP